MRVKKIVMLCIAAFLMITFICCAGGPQKGDQSSSAKEASRADVKWDNDPKGYLYLRNNIKEPLILFAGAVNNKNILGGIRAESDRRIDYFEAVNEPTGTFLLRAVKESVYRSKGSSIGSEDVVYAHIVTFDKKQPKVTQLNIDFRLGGSSYVVIENHTKMALEVVLDSPSADTLTTLAPGEMNKKVYMEPSSEGYVFYPIFKYYDKKSDVIQSVEPDRGVARLMNPAIPSQTVSTPTIKFDNTSIGNLTFRFATLIVRNEGIEAVRLLEGSNRVMNVNRTNVVNPGNETYNIYIGDRPQDRTYSIEYGGKSYPVERTRFIPGNTYQILFDGKGNPVINPIGEFDKSDLSITLLNQR